MKNILNYYYGIIVSERINDNGYFYYNNHLFCLYEYHRNLDEIEALTLLNNYMLREDIYINKIIFNNYNEILTFHEGKYYSLLLINYEYKRGYFHFLLAPMNQKLNILKRNDWGYLWSMKIDYVEYQISHLENTFPLIQNSVNYYIGLSENAISYFKMLVLDNVPLYIAHRRFLKKELYNPLELVIDYKVRDIAEYLKKSFLDSEMTIDEIKKFLYRLNLNNMDYLLLYVRMLYPSFYFDVYDKIINNAYNEENILMITDKVDDYEKLLYEIYTFINKKTNLLGIEWINTKFL